MAGSPQDDDETRHLLIAFGAAIRAARRRLGLTQAQLAERLGRGQQFISRAELGQRNLSVRAMVAIACALGCAVRVSVARRNSRNNRNNQLRK